MADDPTTLEHEIRAVRSDLDEVADEIDRRIAGTRARMSPRYQLRRHPVAAAVVAAGAIVLFGLLRWVQLRRERRIARRVLRMSLGPRHW